MAKKMIQLLKFSYSQLFKMSNFHHLLRRPEPQPSLDECWEPPPIFIQQNRVGKGQLLQQPGLNAEWKVDFCLFKRAGCHFPTFLYHSKAQVRHSQLTIQCRLFGQVRIPLVWISFIELVVAKNNEKKRRRSRGKMTVRGRGIFKMVMFLSADNCQVLWAIRDWVRFLVVRQRIPHLVLGLEFDWASKNRKAKRRSGRIGKKLKNFILLFKCWHIKN